MVRPYAYFSIRPEQSIARPLKAERANFAKAKADAERCIGFSGRYRINGTLGLLLS